MDINFRYFYYNSILQEFKLSPKDIVSRNDSIDVLEEAVSVFDKFCILLQLISVSSRSQVLLSLEEIEAEKIRRDLVMHSYEGRDLRYCYTVLCNVVARRIVLLGCCFGNNENVFFPLAVGWKDNLFTD